MHHLVPPHTAFLLHGRRPSLRCIQHINFLKSVAVAPLSNTSYSNKRLASTSQHVPTKVIKDLCILNNDWQKRFDKERDRWEEKLDEQHKQRLEDTRQITRLETALLSAKDEELRMKNRFNVRGALERIVDHATNLGLIQGQHGVQKRLNALTKTTDFQVVFTDVLANHKLVRQDVESSIKNIYHELSKHAHGNTTRIIIPKSLAPSEVAALVAFMKLQDKWTEPLEWEVE